MLSGILYVLQWNDFVRNRFNKDVTEQTPGCLKAILLLCTIGPIVGYLCSLIAMYFYPLTRKGEIEMQEKLDKMDIKNSEDDLVL